MWAVISLSQSFASQLRDYRNEKKLTQDDLARAIDRNKMSISMFERGTNAPPRGELLEKIIAALSLSESEADNLRYLSAKERNELPNGLEDYFFSTEVIMTFIKAAKSIGLKEEGWVSLLKQICEE